MDDGEGMDREGLCESTIDYPDQLREGIFEFDPPPTAVLKYSTVP